MSSPTAFTATDYTGWGEQVAAALHIGTKNEEAAAMLLQCVGKSSAARESGPA